MPKYSLEQLRGLPDQVRAHIFDAQLAERYAEEIFPLIDEGQRFAVAEALFDVYFRVTTPSSFLAFLRDLLKGNGRYPDVAQKILGYDFQDIADWLNSDIPALILQEGGDPNIFKKKVAASDVVAVIRRKSGVVVSDDILDRRLDKVLASVALGGRKVEQLAETLMGPAKTSGVGLNGDEAALVVAAAEEEMKALEARAIVVVPDEVLAAEKPKPVVIPPIAEAPTATPNLQTSKPPNLPTVPTFETVQVEDIKEVEALRRTMEPAAEPAGDLDFFVERAVQAAALPSPTPESLNRFRMASALYLRDLRDALETKSKLTSQVATGGLGLSEADADRVMTALKPLRQQFLSQAVGQVAADKEKFVAEQARRHLLQQERTERLEKQDLDRRYQDLVQRSGIQMPPGSAPTPAPKAPSAPVTVPVVAAPRPAAPSAAVAAAAPPRPAVPAAPPPKPEPVLPDLTGPAMKQPSVGQSAPTAAPAAPKPPVPPSAPLTPPPAPKPAVPPAPPAKPAPPSAPRPEPPQPPTATAAPPMNLPTSGPSAPHVSGPGYVSVPQRPPAPPVQPVATQKPIVADIIAAPRLTGPVEELRSMTLADFIRLSKEPTEATLKIKDKIDLLEDQGFEVKQQGIKAWHESEVNRLYLELLRASLEGKPVLDVIAAREAAKQPNLSKPQFDAIMTLNRTLRFG